jgi:hypothetical protein
MATFFSFLLVSLRGGGGSFSKDRKDIWWERATSDGRYLAKQIEETYQDKGDLC